MISQLVRHALNQYHWPQWVESWGETGVDTILNWPPDGEPVLEQSMVECGTSCGYRPISAHVAIALIEQWLRRRLTQQDDRITIVPVHARSIPGEETVEWEAAWNGGDGPLWLDTDGTVWEWSEEGAHDFPTYVDALAGVLMHPR